MADTPTRARASSLDDLSGSLLGSYRITSQLNRGGMGAVFRAQHELLGKAAAVKVLRPELCSSAEMVERFFKEARAATAIRHPGIVEVFDFGYHEDGRAYLVMEFLDGEPLSARLAREGLNEIQAAVIARGIASALGAAHAKGITHRDLKPDNIFLVPDPDMPSGERPKVLDFGIAKLAEEDNRKVSKTRTGALMGTPAYMAPEQARAAGEIDQRADLYSLGCVLYEMLTGAPPFVAEGAGEVISLHLFAEAERPSARRAGVSAVMDRITMRLLEKEPAARYQNAFEVVEALSAAMPTLTGRVTVVTPGTVRRQALVVPSEPRARSLRPAILAGVVTLGIAGAVVAFLVLRKEPAPPAPPPPIPTKVELTVAPTTVVTPAPVPDISYHLELTPPDATVAVDGVPVTLSSKGFFSAPSRPDRRLVVVTAPGYQDASITVEGDAPDAHRVVLTRVGDKRHPTTEQVVQTPTRTPGRPDHAGASPGTNHPGDRVESGTGEATATAPTAPATGHETTHDKPDDGTVKNGSGSRWYGTIDDDDDK